MKMSRQIPLNTLRVFESASRLMSFTKAGEELGITQTAVSYQVKLLEDMIGHQLFLRKPRQLVLTEAGNKLSPKITQAFGTIDEAMSSISNHSDASLTIHTNATFASRWLAGNIGTFQMESPNIAVRMEISQQVIDFSRTEADVAIRTGDGDWPGLRAHLLMKGYFTPMVSPALAASIGGIKEPADLLKLRLVGPSDPWWLEWFTAVGMPDVDLGNRPSNQLGAQTFDADAAIAGHGVAIINPDFYKDDVALGRLMQPFDLIKHCGCDYWLAYPEARKNVHKIRLFRDFMRRSMPDYRD